MKKNKLQLMIGVAVAALAVVSLNVKGQPSTNAPPTPQNFFQQAFNWGTAFDTNKTWVGTQYELAVGGGFQNGVQWNNSLDFQYDVNGGNFGIGAVMLNAGIAGTVEAYEAKAEWSFLNEYDLRGELSLSAGYNHQYNAAQVEPKVGLRKKMTAYTFAGIALSVPCMFGAHNVPNQWSPSVTIETGVCGGQPTTTPSLSFHTHGAHLMTRMGNVLNRIGDGAGYLFAKRGA